MKHRSPRIFGPRTVHCHHGAPDESSSPIYEPKPEYPVGDFEPLFPDAMIDDPEFLAELERLDKINLAPLRPPAKKIDLEHIDSPEFLEELKKLDRDIDKGYSS